VKTSWGEIFSDQLKITGKTFRTKCCISLMKNQRDPIQIILEQALAEDLGDGDISSNATVQEDLLLSGRIIVKEAGIIAGLSIAEKVFRLTDERSHMHAMIREGCPVTPQQIVAEVSGPGRALLSGERTALNFLQRMSGIATLTRQFVDRVKHTKAVILDTRKTAPGLRYFDKLAVKTGGGENHRFGLFDMVMIKNNHITAAGSVTNAVSRVLEADLRGRKLIVEIRNFQELQEVLTLKIDRILLDNMSLDEIKIAVSEINGKYPVEVSGNVNLDNVAAIAETGVDYISIGRITHSVRAMDISLIIFKP